MKKLFPFIPLIGIFLVLYYRNDYDFDLKDPIIFVISVLFQGVSIPIFIFSLFSIFKIFLC